jgi:hypothetical protein
MSTKTMIKNATVKKKTAFQLRQARIAHKHRFRDIAGCLSAADARELKEIIGQSGEPLDHRL